MKKYYAVKKGHTVGIFDNWVDCQKAISGYSGADYKGFPTREEAEAYFHDIDIWKTKVETDIQNGYLVSFCDGSFDANQGKYAYGVVLIKEDLSEEVLCGYASNPQYLESRNIAGEILGVINSLDWAVSNGYEKVKIYHDYEGLSKWIRGEWEAHSPIASSLVSVYKSKYEGILEIEFEKVKGHSNNVYNDKADAIAKSALESGKRIAIKGDHWFTLTSVRYEDLATVIDLIREAYPSVGVIDVCDTANKWCKKITLGGKKLTITLYKTTNAKAVIQGEPSNLFQIFSAYVVELLNIDATTILASAYRKKIDKPSINSAINTIFPSFPADYPESIKRLLKQAIINLQYYVESEEYSQYAFPALRALEGHIKYLIVQAGYIVGNRFEQFSKDGSGRYVFAKSTDAHKKHLIEECFNYYKSVRDTTFHFGDILGSTDTTRIIGCKKDADEITQSCIDIINRTLA